MRIVKAETIALSIPFSDGGGAGAGLMPSKWDRLEITLVRLETDDGFVGWGEAFAYSCRTAVLAALNDMVFPLVIGAEVEDVAGFTGCLQRKLHIQGRFGVVLFAISGVDIALWDLAAKRKRLRLADLLGAKRERFPAYASLVRYGDPAMVEARARMAADQGYGAVKLHEITLPNIEAGRRGASDTKLMTDVNCNWSEDETRKLLPEMKALGLHWVEEPIWPPDDTDRLAALGREFGVPLASGENAGTAQPFARIVEAVNFPQPSVTKVGGVSEYLKVADLARAAQRDVMPHCPYFGPGYWASAHLMAAGEGGMFEFLHIEADAWLSPSIPLPDGGEIALPTGEGLGFEPDMAVIERFRAD
ncbi:mandelate racemase/muconate lactonizing enzyme family protein [Pikeienuella piscinae]|uniref:Mandelate racemase/muconate lactonizing enzyme family protein n=1 Tax=Pikeienuella piscinae TaxID=2748098 RepID=A0A7L5BWR6_9RHOB|nr:mandelate racemase/muconate lactonizing enzyme family protein [Pikeienuella piscinae]QIE55891.1 mandelate racemase/muconate lactonizing enzyme family protein [Pikeienuella piscinae]